VRTLRCDKTEEKFIHIFIPFERTFSLVFENENGWWGRPLLHGLPGPLSEIADFEPIFARSASTVTPGKKVQLTLIGSPLRAFQ